MLWGRLACRRGRIAIGMLVVLNADPLGRDTSSLEGASSTCHQRRGDGGHVRPNDGDHAYLIARAEGAAPGDHACVKAEGQKLLGGGESGAVARAEHRGDRAEIPIAFRRRVLRNSLLTAKGVICKKRNRVAFLSFATKGAGLWRSLETCCV
jgi:hypothetical protein